MSEHIWVLENMAVYHAGGLEPAECERLEQHIATCEPCARAVAEMGGLDRTLEAIFADARPDPALEDRMVRALRSAAPGRNWHVPFPVRVLGGAAAVLLVLSSLGAGLTSMVAEGSLPFPGMPGQSRTVAAGNNLKQLGLAAVNFNNQYRSSVSPKYGVVDADTNQLASARDANELVEDRRASADTYAYNFANGTSNSVLRWPEARQHGETNLSIEALAGGAELKDSSARALVVKGGDATKDTDKLGLVESEKQIAEQTGRTIYTYRNELPAFKAERSAGIIGGQPRGDPSKAVAHFQPLNLWGLAPQESKGPQSKTEGDQKAAEPRAQDTVASDLGGRVIRVVPQTGVDPEIVQQAIDAIPAKSQSNADKPTMPGQGAQEAGAQKPAPEKSKPAEEQKTEPAAPPPVMTRKIIRSGEIEFEIDSFDSAVATITKLVNDIKGGFVATVNSEKLPNGKVRGSVVVRVPPERLDSLVLDLRRELGKGGELKGQRIGSQDITKQYTDLESRLRAARAMEERLLQIIKTGKGEIKDLVQAEKELGIWRTKIEEFEGELRYYANLVSLSSLTITLSEKEIRAPFAVIETERIQMGVEVEDVDQAQRAVVAAVAEAKGRVTKSEMKQHAAGQYSALIHFEVAPEAAGPLRDRLKQLGNVARLEIDRLQQTEGGSGPAADAKSKRNDSQFIVALYNLVNVAPRETVNVKLVCDDVEAVYRAILARVTKEGGRVVTSNLSRQRTEQSTGTIQFEMQMAQADAVLQNVKEAGEVMRLQVTENPDAQNTTKSKRGFNVELWALGQVAPRETSIVHLATRDVPAGYRALQEAVAKAHGRVLNAQLNEQDKQNISAQLDFETRRTEQAAVDAALSKIGDVYARNVGRAQDNENVIDSKVRVQVSLINAANLKPRENVTLAVEVANVEKTAAAMSARATERGGRSVVSQVTHKRDGSVVAKLVFDVPLAAAPTLVDEFKNTGILRLQESSQNAQVPEIALAVARLDITVSNTGLIVPSDDGLWPQVRKGLSNSLLAIFWSLSWAIFGLLVVLPWALLFYGIYRLIMRFRKKPGSATTTA